MKFEVIGWTYYENCHYPAHRRDVDAGAIKRAVIEALRAGGYRFGGNTHQDDIAGVPVLNDGTRMLYSMRGWGAIMALALEVPNPKGMAYMSWYMDNIEVMLGEPRRKIVTPPWGVDDKRITKRAALSETFEMHLCPAAFEAVAAGKKTVELRLNDEKHECVCRGDYIEFICGEKRCRVHVTHVELFEKFSDLFEEQDAHEADKRFAHRMSLLRRARFGDCKTDQTLLDFLFATYSEERRKKHAVMAISFLRAPEDTK